MSSAHVCVFFFEFSRAVKVSDDSAGAIEFIIASLSSLLELPISLGGALCVVQSCFEAISQI